MCIANLRRAGDLPNSPLSPVRPFSRRTQLQDGLVVSLLAILVASQLTTKKLRQLISISCLQKPKKFGDWNIFKFKSQKCPKISRNAPDSLMTEKRTIQRLLSPHFSLGQRTQPIRQFTNQITYRHVRWLPPERQGPDRYKKVG